LMNSMLRQFSTYVVERLPPIAVESIIRFRKFDVRALAHGEDPVGDFAWARNDPIHQLINIRDTTDGRRATAVQILAQAAFGPFQCLRNMRLADTMSPQFSDIRNEHSPPSIVHSLTFLHAATFFEHNTQRSLAGMRADLPLALRTYGRNTHGGV